MAFLLLSNINVLDMLNIVDSFLISILLRSIQISHQIRLWLRIYVYLNFMIDWDTFTPSDELVDFWKFIWIEKFFFFYNYKRKKIQILKNE